jgi:hypothetical protein
MSLQTCVILNGPPNVGKDTLAFMLEDYGFKKMAFKDQLYIDTSMRYQVPLETLINRASDRVFKELPWLLLEHPETQQILSPRQALIETSENYIKPKYGKDYFGQAAVRACRRKHAVLAVFSDGGFPEEIKPLQEAYLNTVIIRLHRQGLSFAGDSRSWLEGFKNTHDMVLTEGKPRADLEHILDLLDPYIPFLKQPA